MRRFVLAILLAAVAVAQQPASLWRIGTAGIQPVGGRNVSINGAVIRGAGASLPLNCTVGDLFFWTAGAAGFYQCTTTDTWTLPGGGPGTGITSLGGLAGATQTFANDTNVTIVSAGTTHTLTWAGTLAKGRQNASTVYSDAANTWTTGLQDFSAATHLRVPHSAGYTPTAIGHFGYDETSGSYKGYNGAAKSFAMVGSDCTISATTGAAINGAGCSGFTLTLTANWTCGAITNWPQGVTAVRVVQASSGGPYTYTCSTIVGAPQVTQVAGDYTAFTVGYDGTTLTRVSDVASNQNFGMGGLGTTIPTCPSGSAGDVVRTTFSPTTAIQLWETSAGSTPCVTPGTTGTTIVTVVSKAATTNKFVTNIGADGLQIQTQPTISNLAAFASAALAAVVSDETGSGALVFGTAPTISGATLTGAMSAAGASSTRPHRSGAGSPNARDNCAAVGETFFQTDGTAGANIWGCTTIGTPGTWTLEGAAGSGTVTNTGGALTSHGVMLGAGGNDSKALAGLGTSGQVLTSNGAGADPSFQSVTGTGTVTATGGALTLNALMLGAGSTDSKVMGSLGTTTTLLHGNAAGAPAFSGVVTGDIAANAVGSGQMAVVNTRRTACLTAGAKNAAAALADTDLADSDTFFVPAASTVVEVTVHADGGTPNIIVGRDRAGSVLNFTTSALATAGSGATACSNTGGTLGLDAATTCSSTLQNTGLNAGDWFKMVSGTAGGTAKQMSACITFTIN